MAHVLIVSANFYPDISEMLERGAIEALKKAGVSWEVVHVPGALEIPAAIRFACETHRFSGYIALGCVIRGETYHFEIVSDESARALGDLALTHRIAIGNGILTTENRKQAEDRADPARKNKGGGAAEAALQLMKLKYEFESKPHDQ